MKKQKAPSSSRWKMRTQHNKMDAPHSTVVKDSSPQVGDTRLVTVLDLFDLIPINHLQSDD